ncbi:MAG: CBS domain-containing protein [Gammaproteobacteria bacterium]|nr:CBS domain-containing protein [Gammaproteobacteria bacterium]
MDKKFGLSQIIIPTSVARAGVTVGEAFEQCVTHNVPGIPFCDRHDEIIGRVSLRHTMKKTCIPDYVVAGAHLLGDTIRAVKMPGELVTKVLQLPVDGFVLEKLTLLNPAATFIKAMAVMEQDNTDYAFVFGDDGYQGVITRMGIASLMLKRGGVGV